MNDQAVDKQGYGNLLKQKSNYWIVAIVLIFIVIFSGSGSDQDKMLEAQSEHDHEKALLIASKLLEQNANDTSAKAVITKSGQLFYFLQEAKLLFKESHDTAVKSSKTPGKLLVGLHKAREYTAKAKVIDPKSERLLAFEAKLDDAESKLGYMLAENAITSGQSVISKVSSQYEKITKIVEAAESSAYLAQFMTFQSSAVHMGKSSKEIKETIEPYLQQMDETSQFVANTKAKGTSLSKSLTGYISAVNVTLGTMLAPQGTFKDFASSAETAMQAYDRSLNQLKDKLSDYDSSKTSVSELVDGLSAYKIFHDHSIYQIMASNKSLFE